MGTLAEHDEAPLVDIEVGIAQLTYDRDPVVQGRVVENGVACFIGHIECWAWGPAAESMEYGRQASFHGWLHTKGDTLKKFLKGQR